MRPATFGKCLGEFRSPRPAWPFAAGSGLSYFGGWGLTRQGWLGYGVAGGMPVYQTVAGMVLAYNFPTL